MSSVRRRPVGLVVGVVSVMAVLGGCSNGPGAGPDVIDRADPAVGSSATQRPAGSGGEVVAGDPTALLDAAGLALPPSATGVTATDQPLEPFTDRYLVAFTAPAADVAAMCLAAGLAGPLVAGSLSPDGKAIFGVDAPPAEAMICSGSAPADGQQQRLVLYSGDPAQVQVGIWRMPPR